MPNFSMLNSSAATTATMTESQSVVGGAASTAALDAKGGHPGPRGPHGSGPPSVALGARGGDGQDHTLPRRPWRRYVTPWADIVGAEYKGSGTKEDPFVVDWLPGDNEEPTQWSNRYRWSITMMSAVGMLAVTMGSSILSATIHSIKEEWSGRNDMLYILVTVVYILGFVFGPFIWAPFSEVFGRRLTIIVSFIPFCALNASLCGSPTLEALLVLRFWAGTFGCSAMTNAGATISDMFHQHERGLAMGVFASMPFLGPVLGPVIAGFAGPVVGWRWVAAIEAFFCVGVTIVQLVFVAETYAPLLLRQRAKRLTKATGMLHLSVVDVTKPLDTKALMKRQFQVPFKLMFTEPIAFFCSVYIATDFAILYIAFTSYPIVYQSHRHWSSGIGALAFVPVAIGTNLALLYLALYENPRYSKKLLSLGYLPPEARLFPAMLGAILLPLGLMWFAWTAVPISIHWIVPILSSIPYGAGTVLVFIAVQNYLVDTYLPYAASILAVGTVLRSLIGTILPLFTSDMYNNLGVNWASATIAFIAIAFLPVPFLLRAYGLRIRRWTNYGRESDDVGKMLARKSAAARAEAACQVSAEVAAVGGLGPAAAMAEVEEVEHEVAEKENKEYKEYLTPPETPGELDLGEAEKSIGSR